MIGLKPPGHLEINFTPSPRQYELWKLLQPDYCPHCGGHIIQKQIGIDRNGNPQYKPTCDTCGSQNLPQLILAGGAAGGGKSYLSSCWIISNCMRFENVRAVVCRKTIKSLKESILNTIKKVLNDWGLEENENYKINNLDNTITFWNKSVIIMKELAPQPSDPDYSRLGSSEFTFGAVEECNEVEEKAIDVLFSRLRWRTHETLKISKLLLTCNPSMNWVRDRFVQDKDGNPAILREGEYYCPFSVYDNPDVQFRQSYESSLNKISDIATRERLLYGNWSYVDTNIAAAYWSFRGDKHLVDGLKEKVYDPLKPIISSWDFNVTPYMSTLSMQVNYDKKEVYILEEILGEQEKKENNTPSLSKKIADKYLNENHMGGLLITGDPAGLARSTQTEEGVNNYTIILSNMDNQNLHAQKKLLSKQPPHTTRLEFVNALLDGFGGWKIMIDMRCRRFTEDLIYQKKEADGTKSKAKKTDPKTGVKYEKYGHLSDCFDYALVMMLPEAWNRFQKKKSYIETTSLPVYGGFEY